MDAICSSYPLRIYLHVRTIINIKDSTNKGEHSARPYPFPGIGVIREGRFRPTDAPGIIPPL